VVGGASKAVEQAIAAFQKAGCEVAELPVSHAFHTSIVAPASEPLRRVLQRLRLRAPRIPIVANLNGEFYPAAGDVVPQMLDILAQQVASPVQFSKGLRTLYDAGARVFVEVGPKKALQGFADDVLGGRGDVVSLFTNHPKFGDLPSFNQALCGLYAAGVGRGAAQTTPEITTAKAAAATAEVPAGSALPPPEPSASPVPGNGNDYLALGRMFAEVLERGWQVYQGRKPAPARDPVVITGAALGLPGAERIFDDGNVGRILGGEQFIDVVPGRLRRAMLDKHITRLVKSDSGGPTFETIHDVADVIKLAGRGGAFDLQHEFGVSPERLAALDRVTQLALAAGLDALRDAGIPLVMRYKTTSKGTQLPDRWTLPDALRDDTGVIFASAFPGYDSFADEMRRYYSDRASRDQLVQLESLRARMAEMNGHSLLRQELERRAEELRDHIEKEPYVFDRRFLFRVLSMGHSQFAEFIGARGPNTAINAACASTTQAVGMAEDWIQAGRCRHVIIISADDVTSDHMMEWFGAGFLATGAAATDEVVEDAAIPFDRRRHGMIVGMGAAAMVVESAQAARERGLQPICEVLGTATANSAFHGTRLDVQHISQVMESLLAQVEQRHGLARQEIAPRTVFVSHETYTPARGGSASAEIFALRQAFGDLADRIVIANTKGLTGHAMATGIEDVVAVKALETGCVPPVINFREVDPELGALNLSRGGVYPVDFALRLGAGFGSQISMTLVRWVRTQDGVRRAPGSLGYAYRISDSAAWNAWLSRIAGYPGAEMEVAHRTLRVRDHGPAAQLAEPVRESQPIVTGPIAPAPVAIAETTPAGSRPAAAASAAIAVAKSEIAPPAVTAPPDGPPAAPDEVKQRVLALVAEKTGYPLEMLDLDLDLEADLGVDTVKQAEVFAAIREAYGIPRDEKLRLRDFPTLAHVMRFVQERRPDLAPKNPVAPASEMKPEAQPAPAPAAGGDVRERILALVVEKTGYPKDMLDLDLDLEADLGIDTVKQAEMFAAIREIYSIPRDESRKLRDYPTLAHVIHFVHEQRPELAAPPAPASAPAPAAFAAAKVASSDDGIRDTVLRIVAEKTGYPQDMLDLDLDLEADLGVDTVKQAEMFAAIRAAYNIPRDENLKLRDFPTLASVIKFARERQRGPSETQAAASVVKQEQPAPPVLASLDATNRIPRRVPAPVLRPPLELCKSTGIALQRGRRVALMPDKGGVGEALAGGLEQLGVEVLRLDPFLDAEALSARLKTWLAAGPVHGLYWLPALDDEGDLRRLDLAAWQSALRVRVKLLYTAMRALYDQIAAGDTFLVAATRMGGQHGYDPAGAAAPLGGAVTGFAKAYKRERPDALVKAVDFETARPPEQIAETLIAETLRDPGAVEIGCQADLRWTIALQEQAAADGGPGLSLDKNTVFLVTGAAGSIVSAITADLAAASGGTFYLLDLVPEPDPNDADLQRFAADREGLKRDLFGRIQARGERATPALVEKELSRLERAQAALAAIASVRAAGGSAHYFAVNLTDAEAVAGVLDQARRRSGRIDVLLHAAGMERSRFLPDKDPSEFDLIFDVKSAGWFNLLRALGDMPMAAAVAFSSIAGRFGNAGQTDYSSANDLLCKIISSFRRARAATRAIAIDWTAWAGIGMATRGSIPKMMEAAGIDMLPPEAGIPLVRRELTAGSRRGEIVIGERLGILMNEWDAAGGLDPDQAQHHLTRGPMLGKIASLTMHGGLSIATTLDPAVQPFLHDHQIAGTPVLPGVMGIEAFAEAALCLLPGWHVAAVQDVNFQAPVKFYRGEPRTLVIQAVIRPQEAGLVAECRLSSERKLPNQADPQITTCFTGRVLLAREPVARVAASQLRPPAGSMITAADIYRVYFHGPAYQVVERAWWDGATLTAQLAGNLPANHEPPQLAVILAPRLVELAFQAAGLWQLEMEGQLGLPRSLRQVRVLRNPQLAQGPLYAVVRPQPQPSQFDVDVLDQSGNIYVQLTGYGTVALPQGVEASALRALQALMSVQSAAA
jgi:3-oxoacyl-(acyl-carrier-protein) synthase/NAD(P)-dependent dehydrogenase (short-subunit alcohol dehydrogenase family)/acyl carrier protein